MIQPQRLVFFLAFQHRSVQLRDSLNILSRQLLQHISRLHAVLADDIEIVPPCLARPVVLIGMIDAELTERVRAEQHLFFGTIRHHHFRPVNHRGCDEL